MTRRRIYAAVALLFSLVALAAGQDSTLQIRAVMLDSANSGVKLFVGKTGEPLLPLKLAAEGLTESQKVATENGSLNLFLSATVDPANPLASLAATVKVPVGPSRLIVLIVPGTPGTAPPYRMVVIGDDPASFPWGESRAINLTPVDFGLEIGTQKVRLPGGQITAVPKITSVDEYNRAQTNFYYQQADQWVIAAERQMQYLDTMRRLFVIYISPGALAPDVRTLVDRPPAVPDKAQ